MVSTNPYIFQKDGYWYCMLPNRCYRQIEHINLVEDINWSVVYYKVYQSLIQEKITYKQMRKWPIEKILEVAADIKV